MNKTSSLLLPSCVCWIIILSIFNQLFIYPAIRTLCILHLLTPFELHSPNECEPSHNFVPYIRAMSLSFVKIKHSVLPHPNRKDHNLNKIESTLYQDVSTHVEACLSNCFLRKFKKQNKMFLIFLNFLPLKRNLVLYLNKLENPLPLWWFESRFVEICSVASEKMIIWKVYDTDDDRQ